MLGGSTLTLLLVTLGASGAPATDDVTSRSGEPMRVAALSPAHVPAGLVPQALPPAPRLVVRQTGYYGTVTIDHRAHLARRIACKACHGPGAVTKIEFTPRLAHERCVGCHRVAQRAPTDCKGCHVIPPADAKPVVASAAAGPAAAVAAGGAMPPGQVLAAAVPPGPAFAGGPAGELHAGALRRVVGVGGAAGPGVGPALQLSFRHGRAFIEHSVERLSGGGDARTKVLVGGGITRPLRRNLELVAGGLGGIDVAERPAATIMPALGARVGVEWAPPPAWLVHSVRLSVTGLVDVANRSTLGREVGGAHAYATLVTGFRLGGSR